MQLKLYDTLTRTKRDFAPLDAARGLPEPEQRVRMYACGPTVYDFAHIGNARPLIVFDVLFRLLRYLYGADRVIYVRNITDVDDRINARAAELGISIRDLTERTYRDFSEDVTALDCLPPTVEPRATEHIGEMQAIIERLIAAGYAYVAEDHVLFHVPSMSDYGELSKRPLEDMRAGARVEVAPYKRDPMDFVLWKPSKSGEPAWPAPAGIQVPGRPGWHIECSAMSWKHLGEMFDIHGGGIDLVFPHHENEIAQSRSAFRTPLMARFWMHNGFLQLEGDKMAKSVGNVVTIRELRSRWPGAVLRLQMLMTHYRQPIDWTERASEQAAAVLDHFRTLTRKVQAEHGEVDGDTLAALSDDLNTPEVVTALHELAREARAGSYQAASDLRATCLFLGIDPDAADLQEILIRQRGGIDEGKVKALIDARDSARKAKNFAEADRIRDELGAMGVVLHDTKDGKTTWEIAR